MGALRAAELYSLGMIGHGTVFEWYRDGIIEGDDEVALLHGPAEFGFRPLSEPLVNIRYTLHKAVEEGCLDVPQAQELITCARELHYPNRSYRHLLQIAVEKDLPRASLNKLRHYFSTKRAIPEEMAGLTALFALTSFPMMWSGGRSIPRRE